MRISNLFLFLVVLSVVLLIGCNSATQGANSQNTQNAGDSSAPPEQVNKESMTKDSAPKQTANDVASELKGFISSKSSLQWKIAYDIKSSAQGSQFSSTMTQYFKGENKVRTDMTAQGIETRTYMVDKVLTSCSKSNGAWTCRKIDIPKDDVNDLENNLEKDSSKYSITADGSKVVAGVNTKCYKVVDSEHSATVRWCFSSDGAPLYISFDSPQATSEMTATSYSKSVADSDFEVPASSQTSSSGQCSACDYLSGEAKDACMQSC